MHERLAAELSHKVNAQARLRYPEVAKLLGMQSLATAIAPRLALRRDTPYPYSFVQDSRLVPSDGKTFGRIIKRSRQEGLKEIHASLAAETKEHGWLFIPAAAIWIDTTVSADKASVSCDQYAHIFLSHVYPEIEAVHTHPNATVREFAQDEFGDFSQNYLLEAAQPSANDVIGHYQMMARTAAGCHQVSTIVSHYGATSFTMAKDFADSQGVRIERHNRLIGDPSNPVHAIRQALGRMSSHVLYQDDTAAITIAFEPITP